MINTRKDFLCLFPDEVHCYEYVLNTYKDKVKPCPICGCSKIYTMSKLGLYKCSACKRQYTLKTSTYFHNSNLALRTEFYIIFIVLTQKMSTHKIAQECGLRQAAVWYKKKKLTEYIIKQGRVNNRFPDILYDLIHLTVKL